MALPFRGSAALARGFVRWSLGGGIGDSGGHLVRGGGLGDGAAGVCVALEALEIGAKVRSVLIAEVAILLQSFVDNFFELGRQVRIQADGRNWGAIQNSFGDDAGAFAAEGQYTGGHFIEHDAEGKNVGACVEFLGADLFGRHVGNGAENGARAGKLGVSCAHGAVAIGSHVGTMGAGDFGEAEIENFGMAALSDENVGGLDVAMDDAFGVSGIESVGDFDGDFEESIQFHGLAGNDVLESGAVETFHDHEGMAVELPDFMDGANIGMVKGGSGAGFAAKAFEGL